jgi:hypothetical protein
MCALAVESSLDHHMPSAVFPEIEIRSPQHQAESGTNNLKARATAANIAPMAKNAPGGSAGACGPPLPSLSATQVSG